MNCQISCVPCKIQDFFILNHLILFQPETKKAVSPKKDEAKSPPPKTSENGEAKRGRGRPPGKGKAKAKPAPVPGRGRGRPKQSD
jgi:hypothetical protein